MIPLIATAWAMEREKYVVTTEGGVPGCKIVPAERGSNPDPLWTFPKVQQAYRHIDELCAAAVERALKEAGWAIVPVEPTEAMLDAGMFAIAKHIGVYHGEPTLSVAAPTDGYRAMIAAGGTP